jgi:nucleotide-binding universal stress UspA family protein
MSIRDILLPLLSYPEPTKARAIQAVVDLAENLGEREIPGREGRSAVRTRISALVLEFDIEPGLYFEGAQIGKFLDRESRKSAENAQRLAAEFSALVQGRRVFTTSRTLKRSVHECIKELVQDALLRHLTALPIARGNDFHQDLAEQLIFNSGRPVLVFPENPQRLLDRSFENIAIAWDGSPPAARAMNDAMPFLRRAKRVRIFSATDDKKMENPSSGAEIADSLISDGVPAIFEEVKKTDARNIGSFMESYIANHNTDLLVMGAYGHSRFREFILGGATAAILMNPPSWVLMSH